LPSKEGNVGCALSMDTLYNKKIHILSTVPKDHHTD